MVNIPSSKTTGQRFWVRPALCPQAARHWVTSLRMWLLTGNITSLQTIIKLVAIHLLISSGTTLSEYTIQNNTIQYSTIQYNTYIYIIYIYIYICTARLFSTHATPLQRYGTDMAQNGICKTPASVVNRAAQGQMQSKKGKFPIQKGLGGLWVPKI